MTAYKPRRNDVIAIEASTSYTTLNGHKTSAKRFFLALVARATRKGIVERYRLPDGPEYVLSNNERVWLIGDTDRQRAAGELLRTPGIDNHFSSTQELKDAIDDRLEALR